MKCIIISDMHDCLENVKKCIDWANKKNISQIIACGDTSHLETLDYISQNFSGNVFNVLGNCDFFNSKEASLLKNIVCPGEIGALNINGIVAGACHQPWSIIKTIDQTGCQIVFYGHTHKPWIGKEGDVNIVNPGTLGGVYNQATFAYWETDKNILELKVLDNL